MRIYIAIIITLLLPAILSGTEWENLNVKVLDKGPSTEKDSVKYLLADDKGNTFEVNYSSVPEEARRKMVLALKEIFNAWKDISVERMEFFFSPDAIYANLKIKKISYKKENLMPYIPAGLAFQDSGNGLYYRFRIIVNDQSHMLEGKYTDEEALLKRIYDFIKMQESIDEKTETEEIKHRISVCALGNYLIPSGKLADVFSYGYGGMAGVTLHNTGISLNNKTLFNLDFTLAAGYWQLSEKSDPGSSVSCEINSAYIIPVRFSARLPFEVTKDIFIAPVLGAGYNYNSIDYREPTSGGGYRIEKIREWAPSLSAGVLAGYSIIESKLTLLGSLEYTGIFERYMTSNFYMFSLGVEYSFMIMGN